MHFVGADDRRNAITCNEEENYRSFSSQKFVLTR